MNINRHNYEEYFILYADNELSSNDRLIVDEFVSRNPDLKDELDCFLNTVLSPDVKINFNNKEELLRYDESIMLFVDDELEPAEKTSLEKQITSSPALQKELDLYRKTKLQPDTTIVFEDKAVLYRHSERKGITRMTWIRWSAAAAVLLAVAITTVTILGNKKETNSLAGTDIQLQNPQSLNSGKETAVTDNRKNDNSVIESSDLQGSENPLAKNKNAAITVNSGHTASVKNKKVKPVIDVAEKKTETASNKNPLSNNLPIPQNTPDSKVVIQNSDIAVKANNFQKTIEPVTNPGTEPYNNQKAAGDVAKAEPQFATLAEMEEGGQNKKSRGLFRKLTRVIEKNTGIKATDDNDNLHLAAFTVKLK